MKRSNYTYDDSFQAWAKKNKVSTTCTCAKSFEHPGDHSAACPVRIAFEAWSQAGKEHWQFLSSLSPVVEAAIPAN